MCDFAQGVRRLDSSDAIVLRQRLSRRQVETRLANIPACLERMTWAPATQGAWPRHAVDACPLCPTLLQQNDFRAEPIAPVWSIRSAPSCSSATLRCVRDC